MSDLLNIGKSGLFASKKSLETTGHNLANANTEGYSRQRVSQTNNPPVVKMGMSHGTGVRITGVNRLHDPFIEKKLNSTISDTKYYQSRFTQLDQVQDIFNELTNDGLNQILNRFYNSFRELANQPENETIRSVVRDNASLVVKDFKRIREALDTAARGIDNKLSISVDEVNSKLNLIAKLNKKIASIEGIAGETGDLRDQRDLAVRDISDYFKVNVYVDGKGAYNVDAVGVGTLVSGANVQELKAGTVTLDESENKMAGSVELYFKNRPTQSITNRLKSGDMASLIRTRNNDIRKLQEDIDSIAYEFVNTVNAIHKRGFAQRKIAVDQNGNPTLVDRLGPTTGINFFKISSGKFEAAKNFELSDEVKSDLRNIATGVTPNSPGDNRVALAISKLQHEKVAGDATLTLEELYLQTIGTVGLEANKAKMDHEQAEGILAQTKGVKERMSGVSIDEETANMVRYQHAYEASAKVMKTADEMFATVLGIMPR